MTIGDRMKMRRKQLKISADEIANQLGVSRSTIFRYEKGEIEKLPTERLATIAMILKTTPEELMGWNSDKATSSIETIYNKLEEPRQKVVLETAQAQLDEQEQLHNQEQNNVIEHDFSTKRKIFTIQNSASAANPTELAYGDTVVEEEEFERVPESADFAVPILGDSMEPLIRNGQLVFVKEQPIVEEGEIAIVEIDGDGVTCKQIYFNHENKMVILHSINELYYDREIEPERLRIIGKVVM